MYVLNNAHFPTMPTRQQKAAFRFAPNPYYNSIQDHLCKMCPNVGTSQHSMFAIVALAPAT